MAQAWFATGPEGLSQWELREVEVPAPGPGEVTIRVHAAGINPADVTILLVALERQRR